MYSRRKYRQYRPRGKGAVTDGDTSLWCDSRQAHGYGTEDPEGLLDAGLEVGQLLGVRIRDHTVLTQALAPGGFVYLGTCASPGVGVSYHVVDKGLYSTGYCVPAGTVVSIFSFFSAKEITRMAREAIYMMSIEGESG